MSWPLPAPLRRSGESAWPLPHAPSDAGLTLLEVITSLSITTVITGIFATGIVQSYRVFNATDSAAEALAGMHDAFSRLDEQVRYASAITQPGAVGTSKYIEFVAPNSGTDICTQLRVVSSAKTLQSRRWRVDGTASGWTTLASNVVEPTGFERSLTTTYGPAQQQLTIELTVSTGKGAAAVTESSSVTFTAMNTSIDTDPNDTTCSGMGRP